MSAKATGGYSCNDVMATGGYSCMNAMATGGYSCNDVMATGGYSCLNAMEDDGSDPRQKRRQNVLLYGSHFCTVSYISIRSIPTLPQ